MTYECGPTSVTRNRTPTNPPFARVRQAAQRAAYTAPAEVRAHLANSADAAGTLAATIENVRATTKRGHAGAVDERVRSRLDNAITEFNTAVDAFVTASRKDIDVGERLS